MKNHLCSFFLLALLLTCNLPVWGEETKTITATFDNVSQGGTSPNTFTAKNGTANKGYYKLQKGYIISDCAYTIDPTQSISVAMKVGTFSTYSKGVQDVTFCIVDKSGNILSSTYSATFSQATSSGANFTGTVTLNDGQSGKDVYFKFMSSSTATTSAYARFYSLSIAYTPLVLPTYSITLTDPGNDNTISASTTTSEEGKTITLSYTEATGYYFDHWTVTDANSNTYTVTDNQFTMPATAVTVEGTFNQCTTLAAPTSVEASNIIATGATLSWSAVENASSYEILLMGGDNSEQTKKGITETSYTFTGLTPGIKYDVAVTAVGDNHHYCSSNGIDAVFTTVSAHDITLTQSTGGTIKSDKSAASEGETVTLTYTETVKYYFDSFTVKNGDNDVEVTFDEINNQYTFIMPGAAVEVSATFKQGTQLATPTGLQVTDITTTSATISFDAVQNATKYYVIVGDDILEEITECSFTATGLTPETKYTYHISAEADEHRYYGSSSAEGSFTTQALPKHTITWSTPDGTETTTVVDGQAVELPATDPTHCGEQYTTFVGWFTESAGWDTNPSTELPTTQVTASTIPTTDATYYAVFSDEVKGDLSKTTSIEDGDIVYIATSLDGKGVTGSNGSKDATVSDTQSEWMAFTVVGNTSSFQLKNSDGMYVKFASPTFSLSNNGTDLVLESDSRFYATITSGGNADKYYLQINGSYYRCYKNNSSYTQFYMFKSSGSAATAYISACCTDQATVTVTPTFTELNLGADGTATTAVTCTQQGGNDGGLWTYSVTPTEGATFDGTTFTATAAGEYTIYATYTETCDKSASATITVTKTPVFDTPTIDNYTFTVACGDTTSMSSASTISFPDAYNLTADITVTAPEGFLVSTNKTDGTKYTNELTISPTKSGENAGKITRSVYVRAYAAKSRNIDYSGNITFAGDEIKTKQIEVSSTVTCSERLISIAEWNQNQLTLNLDADYTDVSVLIERKVTNDNTVSYDSIGGLPTIQGYKNTDGTYTIPVPRLDNVACNTVRLNIKSNGVTIATKEQTVPLMVMNSTDTNNDTLFLKHSSAVCKSCDVLVLNNASLSYNASGRTEFANIYLYPGSSLSIPENQSFTLQTLNMYAQNDDVSYAIVNNTDDNAAISIGKLVHIKRIDGKYWYPFSLPYDCKISEIVEENGLELGEFGTDWGIKYYDGQGRQQAATSASLGKTGLHWKMMSATDELKANTGYIIALFYTDESITRSICFTPKSSSTYTEGTDSKSTSVYSWNDNLTSDSRHHGWNFIGSPYISLFGSTNDGDGLNNTNVSMGKINTSTGEQTETGHVYVSIPDGEGKNTYTQALATATTLRPFTAYFVQTVDPTDGNDNTLTLTYSKNNRSLPAAPACTQPADKPILAELRITGNNPSLCDNAGVLVGNQYTAAYEIGDDLLKMYAAQDKPQLYINDAMLGKMAYLAVPDAVARNIQLGLYLPQAGNYTLSLNAATSDISGAEAVYLLYHNAVVANLLNSDYTISADQKGTIEGYGLDIRRTSQVLTEDIYTNSDNPVILCRDGILYLDNIAAGAEVYIYDVLGRLLLNTTAQGGIIQIPATQKGVYTILLRTAEGQRVLKTLSR